MLPSLNKQNDRQQFSASLKKDQEPWRTNTSSSPLPSPLQEPPGQERELVSRGWASSPGHFPGIGRDWPAWLSPPRPDWRARWVHRQWMSAGRRVLFQKQLPWGTYQDMGTNFSFALKGFRSSISPSPQDRLNRKGQWGLQRASVQGSGASYRPACPWPLKMTIKSSWAQTSTTLPSGRRKKSLSPQVLGTISNHNC